LWDHPFQIFILLGLDNSWQVLQAFASIYCMRFPFSIANRFFIIPYMDSFYKYYSVNPYDNAMAENFCSILKTECIYRHKPAPLLKQTK
ncbi:MAG: hypothetical protein ACLTWR_02275, partial [Agathobaculum desmolans]|uniref:hypothetical protein n=1 Tax=Agathobaculum desmolans TaxID=39484 RepID=UPI0039912BDB